MSTWKKSYGGGVIEPPFDATDYAKTLASSYKTALQYYSGSLGSVIAGMTYLFDPLIGWLVYPSPYVSKLSTSVLDQLQLLYNQAVGMMDLTAKWTEDTKYTLEGVVMGSKSVISFTNAENNLRTQWQSAIQGLSLSEETLDQLANLLEQVKSILLNNGWLDPSSL